MATVVEKKTCQCCDYLAAAAQLARLAVKLGRADAEYAPGFSAGMLYTEIELGLMRLENQHASECGGD